MSNAEQYHQQRLLINGGKDAKKNPNKSALIQHLNHLVARWKRQLLLQQVLLFLPILLALVSAILFVLLSFDILANASATATWVFVLVTGLLAKLAQIISSENYASITLSNLIVHLNNRFFMLEDSAQLLLLDAQQLSALEKLQQGKILTRLDDILKQQAQVKYLDLSPQFAKRRFAIANALLVFLLIILTLIGSLQLLNTAMSWFLPTIDTLQLAEENRPIKLDETPVGILSQQVIIEPPSYSVDNNTVDKKPMLKQISDSLDIDTLVGSHVSWIFSFSAPAVDYYIVFSNGERHQLSQHKDGTHRFQDRLTTSMVYHLTVINEDIQVSEDFASVHRINITPDHAPKIRFIAPKSTVTEYGKNSTPSLMAQVQISDDFAITDVIILASIAKGTGEGVKFRDQRFSFDRSEVIAGKVHYYKNWSLQDLAMEPGDELYFSIVATDNREPEAQQTRSPTKIIRWLEAEQSGINADGILIDFMPEYFKSQRQIIIDTIELIEDKADLELALFNEKSELLGIAQSALKEKYGQYLGDEFSGQHSVGVTMSESYSADKQQQPKIQVHDEHGGTNAVITAVGEQPHDENVNHEHGSNKLNTISRGDVSGRMALINRYGHNHEDSDVGVMTNQDPKALMKKSLANMWQAELHLMLSAPELALPFEQQALRLLNLAKKAERIYVKRLGFEPPPVTEQRRYQGEQADILAKNLQVSYFQVEQLSNQTQQALRQFLQLLNQFSQSVLSTHLPSKQPIKLSGRLTADELAFIEVVKQGIAKQIDQRPALLEGLMVIERILLEQQLQLSQCDNCITLLVSKLEQLLPNPIASPNSQEQDYYDQQPLIKSYSQFLEDNL